MKLWKILICSGLTVGPLFTSCSSTAHVVVGSTRPATAPSAIRTFLTPPKKYEVIAIVTSDSNGSFQFGAQGKVDAALNRARKDAAKLGANGLLLQEMGESGSVTIGSGSANAFANGNVATSYGTGIGVTAGGLVKTVRVLAIYVTEY